MTIHITTHITIHITTHITIHIVTIATNQLLVAIAINHNSHSYSHNT